MNKTKLPKEVKKIIETWDESVDKAISGFPDSEQGAEDYWKNKKWNSEEFSQVTVLMIGVLIGFSVAIILFNSAIISVIPN